MTENQPPTTDEVLDWRAFLTDRPVGTRAFIDVPAQKHQLALEYVVVSIPDLQLQCPGSCQCISYCKGIKKKAGKFFVGIGEESHGFPTPCDIAIWYSCEKCGTQVKSYMVRFWSLKEVQKIAEWPVFSPRTPAKLVTLIGPDRDFFLKGRRAEIEGLGIGAFGYYRRVIENQKNRLLDEIIRVARHVGAPPDTIDELEKAKAENQFSKAVESVKAAIPEVLYIKGHNPLTLLHSALSEGLHESSDEACLLAAGDIRLILGEFAERLSDAIKEQKELNDALGRLVNRSR